MHAVGPAFVLFLLFSKFSVTYVSANTHQSEELLLTGVLFLAKTGDTECIELYAQQRIANLSVYSLATASNGEPNEFNWTFPADSVPAESFIYVTRMHTVDFETLYEKVPTYTEQSWITLTGNVLLYRSNVVVDSYGIKDNSWSSSSARPYVKYRRVGLRASSNYNEYDWNSSESNSVLGTYTAGSALVLTAIVNLENSTSMRTQGIELYAKQHVPDLSVYRLGVTSKGEPDHYDWAFPVDIASAGSFIYVTRTTYMTSQSLHTTYPMQPWIHFDDDDNVLLYRLDDVVDRYGTRAAGSIPIPEATCITVHTHGVGAGHPCVFPFTYKNKTYHHCTRYDGMWHGQDFHPWCSVAVVGGTVLWS